MRILLFKGVDCLDQFDISKKKIFGLTVKKPATAGAPTAVSHRVTGNLALLVNKYLKNITTCWEAGLAQW